MIWCDRTPSDPGEQEALGEQPGAQWSLGGRWPGRAVPQTSQFLGLCQFHIPIHGIVVRDREMEA